MLQAREFDRASASGMLAFRNSVLSLVLLALSACTPPYERYMQEGRELKSKNENAGARQKFHNAALAVRSDKKSRDKLADAILAEVSCTEALHLDDDTLELLGSLADKLEADGDGKKAADIRKRMAICCTLKNNLSDAQSNYEQGLEDLKQAGLEKSHESAELLVGLADLRVAKGDSKSALKYMDRALSICDEINDSDSHFKSQSLHKLSAIYQSMNRENEAIAADELAKKIEVGGVQSSVRKMLPKI